MRGTRNLNLAAILLQDEEGGIRNLNLLLQDKGIHNLNLLLQDKGIRNQNLLLQDKGIRNLNLSGILLQDQEGRLQWVLLVRRIWILKIDY